MTTTTSDRTCSWGDCDAEATLSLPGYTSSHSTVRGTEWYCEECYLQRVAELTERALSDGDEADEGVALDVQLDRLGLGAAELVYSAEGYTGRATIGDVVLTTVRAVRVLAALGTETSEDGVWAALREAAASAAEQLQGYELVGEAEMDTLRGPAPEDLTAEARRTGGCVRWHRPSKRAIPAIRIGRAGTERRWMARLR